MEGSSSPDFPLANSRWTLTSRRTSGENKEPLIKGRMDMKNQTEPTEASRQYAAAYAAHYTGRDLPLALQLYKQLLSSYPITQEAGYARVQIQNIVNAVVPKQVLLDAQIELVHIHFEHDGQLNGGRIPTIQPLEESKQV